jgi:hypothetical protein
VLAWLRARTDRKRLDDTVEIVRRRPLVDLAGHVVLVLMLAVPAAVLAGGGALPGPSGGGGGSALQTTGGTMSNTIIFLETVTYALQSVNNGNLYFFPDGTGRVKIGRRAAFDPATPAALAGNVDNYTGCDNTTFCRVDSGGSARNITGIANGSSGDDLTICAVNATGALTLKHEVTSTAANRFDGPSGADAVINPKECKRLWYDGTSTRWRVAQ